MRVTTQYYGQLRHLAGLDEWSCEVADGATVADVWRRCMAAHPAVRALDGRLSCAVNDEFAAMDTRVADRDAVAFLPPVSGGRWTES